MAIQSVLGAWVRKLARSETKPLISEARRRVAEHRKSIASLKRQIQQLTRDMQQLKKRVPSPLPELPPKELSKARLRIDGLKAHRQRLGLSALDYGRLLGVSPLTIYNWEHGKSKPRRSQLPNIVAVRGLGKRDALERLKHIG